MRALLVPNIHNKTTANHAPAIVFCSDGKRHEQKRSGRNSLFRGADLCCRGEKYGSCSHTFAAYQSFEEHRTGKTGKLAAGGGAIFRKETAKPWEGYGNWLLPARMSSRGRRTTDD